MSTFDLDGRGPTERRLLLRGIVFSLVSFVVIALMVMESDGDFDAKVQVTAVLGDIGDGLPTRSDVKYLGVIVGSVRSIEPSRDGSPHYVRLDLDPRYAASLDDSVTARVVPSNVFGVSSVQLIDNGDGAPLAEGAEIPEDRSLETIEFQTALNKAREILSALGEVEPGNRLGLLAAIVEATEQRGTQLVRAGEQLDRIVGELDSMMTPVPGQTSTFTSLIATLESLRIATPDLLDAVHEAAVPLRTVAEKETELTAFLSAGLRTLNTIGTAMDNNTGKLIAITTDLTPVVGVLSDNADQFVPIFTRFRRLSDTAVNEAWDPEKNMVMIKVIVSLSPTTPYTREDCPRYGELVGTSCATAPISAGPQQLPEGLDPKNFHIPDSLVGGNVGPVGSAQEREIVGRILGGDLGAAAQVLLGPLVRGSTVGISPDLEEGDR
ncbi:MCE family protein [Nocardia higoensis]|uniref:MCE family protein n=1 Tax=Nocardia higoensis TaxID=228599 RepID=A0ABS0DB52_9NOCA|nr:MCE family protein [Nocardia higoensis]MBF6355702.1 MCE family protein [Nocardia higoensis]